VQVAYNFSNYVPNQRATFQVPHLSADERTNAAVGMALGGLGIGGVGAGVVACGSNALGCHFEAATQGKVVALGVVAIVAGTVVTLVGLWISGTK
jgi:hypothetical protein